MALSLLLHVLGVVVWVGGMFFAYMALRPVAASVLEPRSGSPCGPACSANSFPGCGRRWR